MILRLFAVAAIFACHQSHASVLRFRQHNEERLETNAADDGKHWAFLVASSNSWDNYNDQASACHSYHVMRSHGIPEENIVTMMYDDIAHSVWNPTPGIIINRPNGSDVYQGVKIDYKNNTVIPENFLAILTGDKEKVHGIGTGRVIESGPNDNIFLYFTDHGDVGYLWFLQEYELSAKDFANALKKMHAEKRYKQIVIYVDACYSGSMFENFLPKDINVYVSTAANPNEPAWNCFWDPLRQTYIGSVYSNSWLEDSDKEDLKKETLETQFEIVRRETNVSHVMDYGDMSITEEPVADFQGGVNSENPPPIVYPKVPFDAVSSEEKPLVILLRKLEATNDLQLRSQLKSKIDALLEQRNKVRKAAEDIVKMASRDEEQSSRIFTAVHSLLDFDCYEPVRKRFHQRCFNIFKTFGARKQMQLLVNMCEETIPTQRILDAITVVCQAV